MRTTYSRIILRQVKSKFNSKSSSTNNCTSSSRRTLSQRTITNDSRLSSKFQTTRNALAVEASSLRYAGYIMTDAEESMVRGWDDLVEDEDGT
eukprot:scaffold10550_cov271-Chaetoceros_neogracile.AAC.43